MKRLEGAAPVLSSVLRLTPWLMVPVLVAVLLWNTQALATSDLFQSGIASPTTSASPTAQDVTPSVPVSPTPSFTVTPTLVEASPTLAPILPTTPTAVFTALPEVTSSPTARATRTPRPTALATKATTSTGSERYPDDEARLSFRWKTLFDSLALALSYAWLACGVVALLLVIALLVVRVFRGRRTTGDR